MTSIHSSTRLFCSNITQVQEYFLCSTLKKDSRNLVDLEESEKTTIYIRTTINKWELRLLCFMHFIRRCFFIILKHKTFFIFKLILQSVWKHTFPISFPISSIWLTNFFLLYSLSREIKEAYYNFSDIGIWESVSSCPKSLVPHRQFVREVNSDRLI